MTQITRIVVDDEIGFDKELFILRLNGMAVVHGFWCCGVCL
jgi:hypothetical protein